MPVTFRRMYGWDGTSWIPMVVDPDTGALVANDYKYPDALYEYTAGVIDYKGEHTSHNPGTDDENWVVYKFTWDGDDLVRKEKLVGAWDDRATLDWV